MANPGDLSSKKVKNTYKRIVQYDGQDHEIYDGTGSRIVDLNVTRITASNASLANIQDLQHLTVSRVQVDTHLSVSGSTFLGDSCADDQVKVHANTWVSGALTVSGSCQGSFRSIGQAKFIYLQNPGIEDQKPARVNRGQDGTGGYYNVPRFGGENAALDVYGNVVITGSLIVEDTIFAQEFHTEIVSESIIFTSGSTKFGAQFDDTMLVTGSIMQSGSDSYFLNGVGIGTSGSQLQGTFIQPGQATPPIFSHLLRIDDQGHDGLGWKNGKVMYATYTTPAEDNFRFRDKTQSDDVFVVNGNTLSVFFTTEDKYNVGIAVPSGSTIDENLVVSSSTNSRTKIESATAATSASLFFESGKTAWEITTVSASTGTNNQMSGSLVFRTQNMLNNLNTNPWVANSTYTEALRLDKTGKVGFNIPSINAYQYPQQIQLSGSLNIIQGRTIDINAGTFHDKDGINGIYFNNQKMIYVSGSGADTSMFFGVSAGGTDAATGGEANIGFGYQSAMAMTTGDYNTLVGYNTGKALTTGGANVFIGKQAGLKTINGQSNIGIGTSAFYNSTGTANYTVAIGSEAMKSGVTTGEDNIAIGRVSLEDVTSGHHNISIGHKASLNLTTADNNIAIGEDALGIGIVTGDKNIAIGTDAGQDMTTGTSNVLMGTTAGSSLLAGSFNVALGFGALDASEAASNQVAIGSNAMGTGVVTGATNVAIGANALLDITSGARNVALGTGTAVELTSGFDNVAIGSSAMGTGIVTGHYNIALGNLALDDITSGNDNIALGRLAAGNLTTGISNIAVGSGSMGLGTVTSHDNIAIGNFALEDNTTGGNNIAIGSGSLANATNNIGNVAIGLEAMGDTVNDGHYNVAIGHLAMYQGDTSGADNIAIGRTAGANITIGFSNVLLGRGAGGAIASGNHNILLGRYAGMDIVGGEYNIALGDNAMFDLTTGDHNIALGFQALNSATSTDIQENIAIGKHSMKDGIVTGDNNTGLGSQTLANLTSGQSNLAIGSGSMGLGTVTSNDNIAIGNFALEDNTSGGNNIAIGSGSLASATDNIGNIALGFEALKTSANDGDRNIAIGYQAIKTGDVSGADNVGIGSLALEDLTTGAGNVAIGKAAALNLTTGALNIAIGESAIGSGITTGGKNVAVGYSSATALTSGEGNVALGVGALTSATNNLYNIAIGADALAATVDDGDYNIAIGIGAMKSGDVSSDHNIAVGANSMRLLTTGNNNIAMGSGSMDLGAVTGNNTVAIGQRALTNLISGHSNVALGYANAVNVTTGHRNIAIGAEALTTLTSGTDNIAIGRAALSRELSENYNIAIGIEAGTNSTGSSNIFIGRGADAPTNIDGTSAINNSIALGSGARVSASNSMVVGNTIADFKTAFGQIYTPNSTLEVSGSVRVTGSLIVSSSNTTTIKGPMFVGQENATDAWTMAHYGDTDTKWVIDDDEMIFTVGDVQMLKMTEDGSQDIVTIGAESDLDFIVTSEGIANSLVVQGSTGNTGLGTTTPGEKLEVIGDISASGDIHGDQFISNTKHVAHYNGSSLLIGNSAIVPIIIGRQQATNIYLSGPVTASGNISASGDVFTEAIYMSQGNDTTKTLNINPNSNGVKFGADTHTLQVYGNIRAGLNTATQHEFNGNISASGNITASGTLFANNAQFGSSTVHINGPSGHITASGNISSSGTVTALKNYSSGYYLGGADGDKYLAREQNGIATIAVPEGGITNLLLGAPVTASGNISASGTNHILGGDLTIGDDLTIGGGRHGFNSHGSNTLTIQSGSLYTLMQFAPDGATTITGNVTASGHVSASGGISSRHQIFETTTLAAVGNAAANGVDLPSIGHQVITGADGTKAATLPQAVTLTVGHTITIQNKAGSALKVFPHSGDTIVPLTQDSAASVPANTAMVVTVAGEDNYVGYFTTVIS